MKRILPVVLAVLAVALVAAGTIHSSALAPATTPIGAAQSLFDRVHAKDMRGAFSYVARQSDADLELFARSLTGTDGSLRTYSTLQKFEVTPLRANDQQATVRAVLQWSSAIGAIYDTRDLQVVREDNSWKVLWPVEYRAKLPPQVIPVNYLRWDVISRGPDDDWGAQNVDPPKVRIISMNAIERDGGVIVMGEIVNEDTVPGFVSVNAALLGKDGQPLAQEESFDKMSHTLLPREVSPFRIDFPGLRLAQVKSVRMQPMSLLVPASADPVIGVLHQRLEKDARGRTMLQGELINQSGQTVNIPHVLATYYDNAGRVIWVSDSYVSDALLPQTPVPFTAGVREDIVPNIHSYRVTVNQYSIARRQ